MRGWISGLVAALGLMASTAGGAASFTLNLQQADLRSLIQTVSERTGRNFVVDPRVDAKVSVVSSTPVNDQELYDIFLSVLSTHGYATVPDGDVTKIVPAVSAKTDAVPTGGEGPAGQLITRVVDLEHVSAGKIVPVLQPLMPQEANIGAYQPTDRLILTTNRANVERLMQIVDRIDKPVENDVDVVRLEHASAGEIVRSLNELDDGAEHSGANLAVDSRTNSVLVSGSRQQRLRMRGLIANLDTPMEKQGNTRVVYLKHADAEDMTEILDGVNQAKTGEGDGKGSDDGKAVIQADTNTNAIILTGPPDRLDSLTGVVRQLDQRRAQVQVKAIIAEISREKAREVGVQFGAANDSGGDTPAALTSFSSGGSNIVELATESALPDGGLTLGGLVESGGTDFGMLVRALASDANNNILSTPSLVTLDNEEAEIVVGQNVPFVTGQFSSAETGGDAQNPFQTIERRDVGITLKVEPQINEGDSVKMNIEQEVSSIDSTASQASDVVTNKRSLKTTVLVDDQQTLVLGGLIDNSVQTTQESVPLLGDIPLLGRLFSYERTSRDRKNLMVFLRPRILRGEGAAERATREQYERMQEKQQAQRERSDNDDLPKLPDLQVTTGGGGGSASAGVRHGR